MRTKMLVKKSLIISLVVMLAIALSSYCLADMTSKDFVKEAKKTVTEISVADAKADIDAGKVAVILDCRTAKEFKKGHLPKRNLLLQIRWSFMPQHLHIRTDGIHKCEKHGRWLEGMGQGRLSYRII